MGSPAKVVRELKPQDKHLIKENYKIYLKFAVELKQRLAEWEAAGGMKQPIKYKL